MYKVLFTVFIIIVAVTLRLTAVFQKPSYEDLIITNLKKSVLNCEFVRLLDEYVIVKHIVRKNENIQKIAQKYGTDVSTIKGLNNLESLILSPKQKILVINKKGHIHKLRHGDTLGKIAYKYKVNEKTILIANDLEYEEDISDKKVLFIPGARINFTEFLWPVRNCRIASRFGLRKHPIFKKKIFHEGLDLAKSYGTPIRSASDGRVGFAGYRIGYGRMVVVYHKDGFSTLYGHLKSYCVQAKQCVKAGQVIGEMGSSGYSTGPHLHFEVRKYDRPVNPIKYLNR
ncbi:MAG: M23 family metallopeptidase [Elusimicrobia bacterium]|nr:M23 family metallopeptidase [Elusimicrobiota bacterium]